MDKPWLRHKGWSRKVRSGARNRMIFTWLFAGVWNAISLPAALGGVVEGGVVVSLLFPVVGVGLVWFAVHGSKQWRRYGVTELTLDPYPGAIGGHVGGIIELNRAAGAYHRYEVILECIYSYSSGSGKNRSRHNEVKWQARGPAEVLPSDAGVRVAFRFDVPAGLPASERKWGDYHLWRLRLTGDQEEVPLDRTFEIAVFPTAERSRSIEADTTAAGRAQARDRLDDALGRKLAAGDPLRELGLTIEQHGDWLRLVLHPGRQKLLAVLFGGVGLVMSAVALFNPESDAFTRLVLAGIGVCGVACGLYLPFNSLDVRVSPREIKRVRTWLGLVVRKQKIRPTQLRELEIAQGSSMHVNDKTTVYYRLVGKGSFGKFRLLESIPDRSLVEAIRERVMAHAGLRQSG